MKLQRLARMRIIHYPDPVLAKRSVPVEKFDGDLRSLVSRMFELLREAEGVGLAAPQVGVGKRMFICNATGKPEDDLVCVNPNLIDLTGNDEKEERCLSVPGATVTVRRAAGVTLDFFDLDGQPHRLTGTDLLARVWQHEMDHLDGRLIIDTMSAADEIANRRAIKQLQGKYQAVRHR